MRRSRIQLTLILALFVALVGTFGGQADGLAAGGTIAIVDTGDVGYFTSMKLNSDGNPVIAHYRNGGGPAVKLAQCGNSSCTAGNTNAVLAPSNNFISLDLDASGAPVIASRVSTGSGYALQITRCSDAQCSSVTNTITAYGATPVSLALDAAGFPVVAYDGVTIVHCNDANCAGVDDSVTIPTTGSDPSLVLNSSGNPVAAFHGVNSLGILTCNDADCTASSVAYPDVANNTGETPSLELDASGNPVVAYFFAARDLKVLHCGNPQCTADNSVVVAVSNGNSSLVAMKPSIALDQGGNPVVAFPNNNGSIMLLRCGNPVCTSGNEVRRIDTGNAGGFPSLALDSSDRAIIAYQRQTGPAYSNDLKAATCASSSCDADDDGCADTMEAETESGREYYGGRRDYLDSNDYFNPSHDGQNRVDDILLVVEQYFDDDSDGNPGLPPYAPGYTPDTDRTLVGPLAWNLGPPNGLQRVDDILNQVKQYFHDCA